MPYDGGDGGKQMNVFQSFIADVVSVQDKEVDKAGDPDGSSRFMYLI